MISLTTLVFPDTLPSTRQLTSLLPLFEPVVYCRPVEDESFPSGIEGEEEILTDQNLCRRDTPAPLGDDRERFMRLVNDLATRRDDYAAQLSYLTLAAISNQVMEKKETRNSILSQLLHSHGIESEKEEKKRLLLWQARLVLKLAEIVGSEEGVLDDQMKSISQRERSLFDSLREDGKKNPFESTRSLAGETTDQENVSELQLKAWSRLFAAGDNRDTYQILTTSYSEVVSRLTEEYKIITNLQPQKLFSLLLPAPGPNPAVKQYLKQRSLFRKECSETLEHLAQTLHNSCTGKVDSQKLPDAVENSWNTLLQNSFPAEDFGRCQITFFLFKNISAADLFLQSFGKDDDEQLLIPRKQGDHNTIIGLLN